MLKAFYKLLFVFLYGMTFFPTDLFAAANSFYSGTCAMYGYSNLKKICMAGRYYSPSECSGKGVNGPCRVCPAGYYCQGDKTTLGDTPKKKCAAGTYSTGESKSCLGCASGFYSGEGATKCEPCPKGTYSNHKTGKASCTKCPDNSDCAGALAGVIPSQAATGFSCHKGYRESDKKDSCVSCGSDCAACSLHTMGSGHKTYLCDECASGYILIQGPQGSQYCQRQCGDGSYLYNYKECRTCPAGCKTCSSGNYCGTCKTGYKLNDHKCEKITCAKGQYLDGNTCKKCTKEGCSECSSEKVCTACSSGYQRYVNSCIKVPEHGKISASKDGVEIVCEDGYTKSGDKCVCKAGYLMRKDGTCAACPKGYSTNGVAGDKATCTKCPAGSIAPEEGTATCISCAKYNGYQYGTGYAWCRSNPEHSVSRSDGTDYICDEGWWKYRNYPEYSCKPCPANYKTCDRETHEFTCKDGYEKWGFECRMSCPEGCTYCTEPNVCAACQDGYYKFGSSCLKVPENATRTQDGTSFTCNDGFYQEGSACNKCPKASWTKCAKSSCSCVSRQCPVLCGNFVSKPIPTECKPGYVLKGDACLRTFTVIIAGGKFVEGGSEEQIILDEDEEENLQQIMEEKRDALNKQSQGLYECQITGVTSGWNDGAPDAAIECSCTKNRYQNDMFCNMWGGSTGKPYMCRKTHDASCGLLFVQDTVESCETGSYMSQDGTFCAKKRQ